MINLPANSHPFRFAYWANVPARAVNGATGQVTFGNPNDGVNGFVLSPPPTYNFPVTIGPNENYWITDITYQSKCIRNTNYPETLRSSYAVINSVWTMTEHCPYVSFEAPIILPSNFVLSGTFINQAYENQNMLIAIHGYIVPV